MWNTLKLSGVDVDSQSDAGTPLILGFWAAGHGQQDAVKVLLEHSADIPVTYAGGVTEMADLERIKVAGMGRVDVTVGTGQCFHALDIFGGNLAVSIQRCRLLPCTAGGKSHVLSFLPKFGVLEATKR